MPGSEDMETLRPSRRGSKKGLRVARATRRRREARLRRIEDNMLLDTFSSRRNSSQRERRHEPGENGASGHDPNDPSSSDTSTTSSDSSSSRLSFTSAGDLSSTARRSDSIWTGKTRRAFPYKRKTARERFDALVRSRRRFFGPDEFNVGELPNRPRPFSFLELMNELTDFRQSVSCQERWIIAWFPELLDGYALEMKHDILVMLKNVYSLRTHSRHRGASSRPQLHDVEQAMRKVFFSEEQRDLAETQLSALCLPRNLLVTDLLRAFHDTERKARNLCFILDASAATLSNVTRRLVKGIKAFEVLWSHLLRETNYGKFVETIKSHLESYAANRREDPSAAVEFVRGPSPLHSLFTLSVMFQTGARGRHTLMTIISISKRVVQQRVGVVVVLTISCRHALHQTLNKRERRRYASFASAWLNVEISSPAC